jgi:peptide/nickel transport system permease protein
MSDQSPIAALPEIEAVERAAAGKSYWARVRERLLADRLTLSVMLLLSLIIIMVLAAPLFATHDPTVGSVLKRLKSPGTQGHWLGTDEVGRDLWSRILYGGRYSLLCGVLPVFLALLIGGSLGLSAGYFGGITNSIIMRSMDVLYAFPSILLAVAICGMLGSGIGNTILALTVTFIPPMVRISETVTTQVRAFEFVEAARASGARPLSIMYFHILNNVLGPILVYATSLISISIILAAGLSFLGLGVTPPDTEWGLMLNNLRQAIWVNPLVAALPGAMIFITSMCFNLMSDGLRGAMDVRM